MILKDKNIILGVTGAISAYKSLEITRLLVKEDARVFPVMTGSAREFITPLSLSTLARCRVFNDLFEHDMESRISHIELAEKADLVIIAPATANFIGKLSAGLADDLLSTIILATRAPVVVAPSMNSRMYENPVVSENIKRLKGLGFNFVGPEYGELACGYEGKGRLADVEDIVEAARECLSKKDFLGEKVLVTAGPTREAIDPVRFVSNASSGRMGYAIARACKRRGAEVVLVSGPSYLTPPKDVTFVKVQSAEEMADVAIRYYPQSTVVIMAAAIADYRPIKAHPAKVKKDSKFLTVEMERTMDILKEMGEKKKGRFLVGFALETEEMEENAKRKLREKNLDLVIANSPGGLDSEVNQVIIIDRYDNVEFLPPLKKDEVAEKILDRIIAMKK